MLYSHDADDAPICSSGRVFDHVGITVPDLEAGIAFFADLFGARELYRLGPFDSAELPAAGDGRDWTAAHVNVPGARFTLAMLQLPDGVLLELFQYDQPEGAEPIPPRNNDIGGHHLAFAVTDLDAAVERLRARGLELMNGPIVVDDGPVAGLRVQYFLSPWGMQLELVQHSVSSLRCVSRMTEVSENFSDPGAGIEQQAM
ncbi:VOC family protein [Nocardia sp. NPDC101769]|uniref:VOC family protein n=1 Tax=Nocardia sp. NPDC101769 TaxID=3364333 RepID=UPI00382C7D3D